jgi:hypothetical protein
MKGHVIGVGVIMIWHGDQSHIPVSYFSAGLTRIKSANTSEVVS